MIQILIQASIVNIEGLIAGIQLEDQREVTMPEALAKEPNLCQPANFLNYYTKIT